VRKYVPRSIQNIHDRTEARNESITEKLYTEDLATTFEVTIYTSLSPETTTPIIDCNASNNELGYHICSARSKAGHHDNLEFPEVAKTRDEYEKFRNAHFQAIIKKSDIEKTPQQGDVWLATHNGGNLVTLVSKQREGTIVTEFKKDGPARNAHAAGNEPAQLNADYSETSTEQENMMDRNKKSRDILKDQLKGEFEAQGITFHVTSEVRNVDKQANVLKKMYTNSGREEVLSKYGRTGTGKEIVQAIETGDDVALRVAAQKSTRHLRGLALDIRTRNLTNEQVNKAINIIKGLGLRYILEQTKTGCWDKPGTNVTNVKRLASAGGGPGEPCYAEHLHVDIPEGYGS